MLSWPIKIASWVTRLLPRSSDLSLEVFETLVKEELSTLFLPHGYSLTFDRDTEGGLAARFLKGETGFVFAKDFDSEYLECIASFPATLTLTDSAGHAEQIEGIQHAGLAWLLSLPEGTLPTAHVGFVATEDSMRAALNCWSKAINSYAMDLVADERQILSLARNRGMTVP